MPEQSSVAILRFRNACAQPLSAPASKNWEALDPRGSPLIGFFGMTKMCVGACNVATTAAMSYCRQLGWMGNASQAQREPCEMRQVVIDLGRDVEESQARVVCSGTGTAKLARRTGPATHAHMPRLRNFSPSYAIFAGISFRMIFPKMVSPPVLKAALAAATSSAILSGPGAPALMRCVLAPSSESASV